MVALEPVEYRIGEQTFTGLLADGTGGAPGICRPGVVVAHEGPGITEHTRRCTVALGELGYVAFAADLYGEPDLPMERAKELVRGFREDRTALRVRANAALEVLLAYDGVDADRMAAIGFCFGGMAVLELARGGADVKAVVGFHADLTTARVDDAENIRGKVLVCLGADDPIVDAKQRDGFAEEMTAAKVDWQMQVYGGVGHSFTNRDIDAYGFPGFAYNASAERRSWRAMRAFFDEVIGSVG